MSPFLQRVQARLLRERDERMADSNGRDLLLSPCAEVDERKEMAALRRETRAEQTARVLALAERIEKRVSEGLTLRQAGASCGLTERMAGYYTKRAAVLRKRG